MKVLHLGKFDVLGGIERHVRSLITGLAKSGEVQSINLVSAHGSSSYVRSNDGYITIAERCWGTPFSVALSPTLPARAVRLQREHRFDVVHLNFPDPLGHLTALMLPRTVKRVVTWHSDIVRQRRALALYRPALRHFLADADAIIGATPQHLNASEQIPAGKAEQVRAVIPYGFDPAQMAWSPAAHARATQLQASSVGRAKLFSIGRHVYYKGFDVLIRALRDIDAVLWLGGTGPMTDDLRQLAAEVGVQHRIHFTGYIREEELVAYYASCDVFVLPSTDRSEAFGLVQLEAMHCGKPVVATRLGTGVEFVNRDGLTGLLVPPKDASALAGAINQLLGNAELRSRMGAAGHARVAQDFSLQQMIDATLDVYRSVLA